MSSSFISDLIPRLTQAVCSAAEGMQSALSSCSPSLQEQSHASPHVPYPMLAELSAASHHSIVNSLGNELPIISKVDPASLRHLVPHADVVLLDPLDGRSSTLRYTPHSAGQLGFGPLLGVVRKGELVASVFYNVSQRSLYVAERGSGCWMSVGATDRPSPATRVRLISNTPPRLQDCALLFFPGSSGELQFVEYVRARDLVENAYRFGGFANDCTRIAQGYEQLLIQYQVPPWDFPATLFATEAGLSLTRLAPKNQAQTRPNNEVLQNNPVLITPSEFQAEALQHLGMAVAERMAI